MRTMETTRIVISDLGVHGTLPTKFAGTTYGSEHASAAALKP